MSFPAEAFIRGYVRQFESGQLLTHNGIWYLLTDAERGSARIALVFNGPQRGRAVELRAEDTILAIAPAFRWRPMVPSVPSPEAAHVGSLFFGPTGPAFRSWAQGQPVYAFDCSGREITRDFPYDAVSVPTWSVGLYWPDPSSALIGVLFEIDATPSVEGG